jgi:hypothetical protein
MLSLYTPSTLGFNAVVPLRTTARSAAADVRMGIADMEGIGPETANKIWDPLELTTMASDKTLAWYRHAELKHGRVAMAAFVGFAWVQVMAHDVHILHPSYCITARKHAQEWQMLTALLFCCFLRAVGGSFLELIRFRVRLSSLLATTRSPRGTPSQCWRRRRCRFRPSGCCVVRLLILPTSLHFPSHHDGLSP